MKNYALVVTASCSMALGFKAIVPRLQHVLSHTKVILGRLVPFAAVISAGVTNVFLMRSEELKKGISVYDKAGNDLGSSKTVAYHAVGETAVSRVVNAAPIMVIPPLILVSLQNCGFLKGKSKLVETGVNIGLIFATSLVAYAFRISGFPAEKNHPHFLFGETVPKSQVQRWS